MTRLVTPAVVLVLILAACTGSKDDTSSDDGGEVFTTDDTAGDDGDDGAAAEDLSESEREVLEALQESSGDEPDDMEFSPDEELCVARAIAEDTDLADVFLEDPDLESPESAAESIKAIRIAVECARDAVVDSIVAGAVADGITLSEDDAGCIADGLAELDPEQSDAAATAAFVEIGLSCAPEAFVAGVTEGSGLDLTEAQAVCFFEELLGVPELFEAMTSGAEPTAEQMADILGVFAACDIPLSQFEAE